MGKKEFQQECHDFTAVLQAEIEKPAATLARTLIARATNLHKRYENECSYEWACTEEYAKSTERQEKQIVNMLVPYGITVDFNGDPRGAPVRLKLPKTKKANDWGGEGFYCVPYRTAEDGAEWRVHVESDRSR